MQNYNEEVIVFIEENIDLIEQKNVVNILKKWQEQTPGYDWLEDDIYFREMYQLLVDTQIVGSYKSTEPQRRQLIESEIDFYIKRQSSSARKHVKLISVAGSIVSWLGFSRKEMADIIHSRLISKHKYRYDADQDMYVLR